jgi:hypothetical protein
LASRLLLPRVVGALLLRPRTYQEVAQDRSAGLQAGLIIVIVGVIEAAVISSVHGDPVLDSERLFYSVLAALFGWIVWSGIVFVVGSRLFEHALDFRAILRAVAFAHAPAIPYGLAALPGLTEWAGLLLVASLLWFAAAMAACVQGAMEVSPGRSFAISGVALASHEVLHQALRLAGLMA